MTVYFVGAGPGDPELLTRKADRLLSTCDVCIYAGSLVAPAVLERLPAKCQRFDSAGMTLEDIITIIEEAHPRGLEIVRLHSGDPSVYGAIGEQMVELEARGIGFEVVPGVSAFQAAAASLGRELTAPEVAQTVILTRIEGRTPKPAAESLEALAQTGATLCLYLSVHKIEQVAARLAVSYGPACPAAVVYRASWPDEQRVEAPLAELPERVRAAGIRSTALILVGPALSGAARRSRLYAPEFGHGFRGAAGPAKHERPARAPKPSKQDACDDAAPPPGTGDGGP